MRIVYLWDSDYPWDVRTEKVCAALTRAGHDVHLVARNRGWLPPREPLPEGTVHRMPPWRWCGKRLDALLSLPAFFNPRWIAHLARVVRSVEPDLVVVRDLPLCPTALRVGRSEGIPVVFDMAENYPALLRALWTVRRQRPWDGLVRNPRLASLVERWCLPRVSHTIAVVEESAERLVRAGVDPGRITVVSNTPPRSRAEEAPGRDGRGEGEPLRLVYLGIMEVQRGMEELLEAVHRLRERGVPVELKLVGEGRDRRRFQARAAALGLAAPEVEIPGFLPRPEALAAVAGADVGIIANRVDEGWNTTIPNKLFDYMAVGIPVLSSDAAPCRRILAETGAGLVFRSGDVESLAQALLALRDPARRARMGAAGRAAVLERYNWERDSAVLLEAIGRATGRGAGAPSASPSPRRVKLTPPAAPTTSSAAK